MNSLISITSAVLLAFVSAALPVQAQQQKAKPVSVIRASQAEVHEEIPLTGSVIARRISRISPRVEGFVLEILVDEGDRLNEGDVILKLDPELAKIAVARAR